MEPTSEYKKSGADEAVKEAEIKRQIFEKVRRSMIEMGIESPERSRSLIGLDSGCPIASV